MLDQFKIRLLRIYMLTMASLLLLILAILYMVSLNQNTQNNVNKFEDLVNNVTEELMLENRISYDWLSKMETKYQLVISISSNSIPIRFEGAFIPPTDKKILLERLYKLANQNNREEDSIYSFYGDKGDHYYGYISYKESSYHFGKKILILQYMMNEQYDRHKQTVLFFFISVAAMIAVYVISRVLVKISLQPVKEGLTRQNEFIAAASHELRSPLTVIMAGIGNLKLAHASKEEIIPCMEREGQRMAKLIQDMLLIASSDAKTWNLNLEKMEPETFFVHIYEILAQICSKKSQKPDLILQEEELPPIICDKMRLEQILLILIDNACSYSPEQSEITIQVSEYKKNLRIEVIDRGSGIPEEERKRIFERFYRSDGSRNDKTHFGLGLSIAAELVNLHRGKLWVKDTTGGGTTFVAELPIHAPRTHSER